MTVERRLQIVLVLLSILGTILLGLGENDSLIPLAMLVAAPCAAIFTDGLGWLRLNRPLANIAALAAVGYTVVDFLRNGAQNQLLAIANLLLYLQLILLFQEKNLRVYWQLLVLSLLEVVVAAAMNLSFHFGVLLLLYLALALIALVLQFVLRESRRWSSRPEQAMTELLKSGALRPVYLVGLVTIVFSLAMFYATPRIQGTSWVGSGRSGARSVGFSRNVSLDEMGRILESHELAMRVSFFDPVNNVPYLLAGQTYFRGAVLTRYSEQIAGRWSPSARRDTMHLPWSPERVPTLVAQEIWLEPTATPTLFSVAPAFRLHDTPQDVVFEPKSGELQRSYAPPLIARQRWQYRLATTGLLNGRSLPLIPDQLAAGTIRRQELYAEIRDCEHFDRRRFPQLAATAEQILREAGALDADRIRKARILEAHFLHSGIYTYSLDFRFPRQPGMDPIEDFIGRHHTGHCEYFATALVLMLRSQKIPARLVVGYKGGEYNAVGNYLLVRQDDAHAWVEVHLESEEVDLLNIPGWHYRGEGAWWRLDPTPAARDIDQTTGSWRTHWDQALDYAEFLWSDYVQGMGPERQRQSLYDPLLTPWREQAAHWLDIRLWPRRLAELARTLRFRVLSSPLYYAGLILLVVLVGWLVHRHHGPAFRRAVWERWQRLRLAWKRLRPRAAATTPTVAFYRQFEDLLAKAGQRRPAHLTPREWLDQMATLHGSAAADGEPVAVRAPAGSAAAPALPSRQQFLGAARQLVDQFYRVRYSQTSLAPAEQQEIEQALAVVGQFVRAGREAGMAV